VIYKLLLETVGLTSYLPYLGVLLLFHIATAAGLFVVITRQAGAFLALAMSALFLFLGAGSGPFLGCRLAVRDRDCDRRMGSGAATR
jgi:hypothetical protein